jgi:cytochrome c biogenesis protein CcmG/thiol:disulfide interchange protein DsbE
LNVWASWCQTCSEEQAFLSTLTKQGVVIYGLNYKDGAKQAKRWLKRWGNPYVLIGVDPKGKAAIDLGVYGTPETFLIDKKGVIQYRHAGALNAQIWKDIFVPKIRELTI